MFVKYCGSQRGIGTAYAVTDVITDMAVLVLPRKMVSTRHLITIQV